WIFRQVSYKNKKLQAVTQAGLVNNMNDGMSWGVFPIFFMKMGVDLEEIGWIRAVYPLIWGIAQVVTGPLSDKIGRKQLIVPGMFIQAGGLFLITGQLFTPLTSGLLGSALLGIGTAMVYPTLMAVVSDSVHPARRASSLGVYRFWRDMGYAVGALFAGITANMLGFDWTIRLTAIITALSGIYVWVHLKENKEQTTA
ncbi:MAG TPA: MFS transporter, partial [Saprospiraceae bacterium]|nr:MFS transporter [Saprospiraceae bacterium]